MSRVLAAMLAKLFIGEFALNQFLILPGIIIDHLAGFATQLYEIF